MTDQIETDDNNTWWKAPRFLISAVLVALLIVLGVVLWLWPDGEEPTQAAPAPATTAEPVSGEESVCGLDATGGTTLTKLGSGTLFLVNTGGNSFTGGTTVTGGTLEPDQ